MNRPEVLPRFIVLEGLDGSGTTTQRELLEKRLVARGIRCWATCEPTDGPIGALIRSVLRRQVDTTPESLAHLFAADRHDHLFAPGSGILARTAAGEVVVSDRYLFSSLAYQSVQCGLDFVASLNSPFPLPELLLYLDVPAEVAVSRSRARGPAELFEHLEFQSRVRDLYRRSFDRYQTAAMKLVTIDGTEAPDAVAEKIWSAVESLPIFEV